MSRYLTIAWYSVIVFCHTSLFSQCDVSYNNIIYIDSVYNDHLFVKIENCKIDSFLAQVFTKYGEEIITSRDIDFKWYPDRILSEKILPQPQYMLSIVMSDSLTGRQFFGGDVSVFFERKR